MIRRNPTVPDHFLVLDRQSSFGEYARAYGDQLADHYENRGVIVVPHMPIDFDLEYFQMLTFPPAWKKIGTANGIEKPVFTRSGENFEVNQDNPLVALYKNPTHASYVQCQIASFNAQLRAGVRQLFPYYHSLQEANITWRLCETPEEGMHMDVFGNGIPVPGEFRALHRLKVFINIDTLPRRWRTSFDMARVLKAGRGTLPQALPNDVNVVSGVIDKFGVLKDLPYHEVDYPTMSAVFVNAEVVAHEVVYGRRMVAVEMFCDKRDMLDARLHTHECLPHWLKEAGYDIAADPAAVAAQYAKMKGSYQLLQDGRERAAEV